MVGRRWQIEFREGLLARVAVLAAACLCAGAAQPARAESATVQPARAMAASDQASSLGPLLTGGHVAFVRHALAPGTGDPPGFTIGDCATQRSLSAAGRAQARRIGAALRAAGVARARVFSSQWCRCLETARLLGLGDVEPLPALNSFYQRPADRDGHLEALRTRLASLDTSTPVVLVTHQLTISAMTHAYPASGELFVTTLDAGALARRAPLPIASRVLIDP